MRVCFVFFLKHPLSTGKQRFFEVIELINRNQNFAVAGHVTTNCFFPQIDSEENDVARRSRDFRTGVWQTDPELLVIVMLITHATHQTSADTGDFRRIQSQILLFHHADTNGRKLVQPVTAATLSTAGRKSFDYFGLIAHTNLTQFYSCFKNSGQISYKSTEINPLLRGKVEKKFFSIGKIFHINQLHL